MSLELRSQQTRSTLTNTGRDACLTDRRYCLSPRPRCVFLLTQMLLPLLASVTLAAEAYASIYPC